MKITIRYFASIREALDASSEQLDSNASTLGALRDQLLARGGGYAQALAREKAVRVALNQVMSEESALLLEGCEVAFFPPVTGG
ncbi:MAG: molybdopterin converting factor subunit 1 [Betaproteobacteria bacterium]